MMIKPDMGLSRIALYVCIATSLTACGHSTPSESDAKAAIQTRLGDCKYFSIDSFTKTNGILVDDNNYQVVVKYTIKMSPTDTNKQVVQTWKEDDTKYQDLTAQLKAKEAASPNYLSDPEIQNLNGTVYSVQQKARQESSPYNLSRNVAQECPTISKWALAQFFDGKTGIRNYDDDVSFTFTETIPMEKTDNGWQETR